jgi:hypothetical protein
MFSITKGGAFKFKSAKPKGVKPKKTGTAPKFPAKGQGNVPLVVKKNPAPDAQAAMVPGPVGLVPLRQGRTPRKMGPY